MNAEQRRRYLRDRVVDNLKTARDKVGKITDGLKDPSDAITLQRKYDLIKSGKAKLRSFTELTTGRYRSYGWDDAYIFDEVAAAQEHHDFLETTRKNAIEALEKERVRYMDLIHFTDLKDAIELVDESKATFDKIADSAVAASKVKPLKGKR